jgi:hypothetical protein
VRELRERGEYGAGHGFRRIAGRVRSQKPPGPHLAGRARDEAGAVFWKTALDDKVGGEVRVVPREAALTEVADERDRRRRGRLRHFRRSGAAQRRAAPFVGPALAPRHAPCGDADGAAGG